MICATRSNLHFNSSSSSSLQLVHGDAVDESGDEAVEKVVLQIRVHTTNKSGLLINFAVIILKIYIANKRSIVCFRERYRLRRHFRGWSLKLKNNGTEGGVLSGCVRPAQVRQTACLHMHAA